VGEVATFKAVREVLAAENPDGLPAGMIEQYTDLFVTYREATLNIAKCGSVTAHPKTGAPLENPYLKVRQQTLTALRGFPEVKAANAWAALARELDTVQAD